ncbi:MAG: IS5 family transposase [Lawsonibacter sp.]|nr:IS5 family transposase [Lawsonibacter sp.]
METSYHRHDISDNVWAMLEPHLPGKRDQWGGIAQDNRRFINAVFWVLRTGAPWRDLPPDYGKWGSVHQRFIRWRRKGVWEKLLEILIDEPDYEWLMIDASHIEGISAETLLADRGYDTNDILAYAVSAGMEPVIPSKKNRKEQRDYDKYLYKQRHLVENCFLILKRWRGIATRYAKT